MRGDAPLPRKAEFDPLQVPRALGHLCILEVKREPLDFVYRLDGTNVAAAANEDLSGRSILDGTPSWLCRQFFQDIEASIQSPTPTVWRIQMAHGHIDYDYLRLVLPFHDHRKPSDQGAADRIDALITLSYSLRDANGFFPPARKEQNPALARN